MSFKSTKLEFREFSLAYPSPFYFSPSHQTQMTLHHPLIIITQPAPTTIFQKPIVHQLISNLWYIGKYGAHTCTG